MMTRKTKLNFFPYFADGKYYDKLEDIPSNASLITQPVLQDNDFLQKITNLKLIGTGAQAYAFQANISIHDKPKTCVLKIPRKNIDENYFQILNERLIQLKPILQDSTPFKEEENNLIDIFTPFKLIYPNKFDKNTHALLPSTYAEILQIRTEEETRRHKHPGIDYIHTFYHVHPSLYIIISEPMEGDVYKFFIETKKEKISAKVLLQFQLQTGLALDYLLELGMYMIDFKPLNVFFQYNSNSLYHFKVSDFDSAPKAKTYTYSETSLAITPEYQLGGVPQTNFYKLYRNLDCFKLVFVAWHISFAHLYFMFWNILCGGSTFHNVWANTHSEPILILKKMFPFLFQNFQYLNSQYLHSYYFSSGDKDKFTNTLRSLIELYNQNTNHRLKWSP